MLTQAQRDARAGKLTASRCGCLVDGDEQAILRLWLEMTGQEQPEDLSGVWPVQLGITTEDLNLNWYEIRHGQAVTRRGEVVVDPDGLFAATLDGWIADLACPIECKHVGGREPLERTIERYAAQLHMQMELTGARQAALSVIRGADQPTIEFIDKDDVFAAELMRRGRQFMRCVTHRRPPVPLPKVAPTYDQMIEVDMSGVAKWEQHADIWLQSWQAAVSAKDAEKILKGMVPPDARKAFGSGVRISRDRAGRLSLREDA